MPYFYSFYSFDSSSFYNFCYFLALLFFIYTPQIERVRMEKKRCPHCRCYFIPHPSVSGRQKACGKSKCQKLRKAKNNRQWRKKNPKYYKGDYPRVKGWLDKHPGYLKEYRQNSTEYRNKNRESQSRRHRSKKICLDIQQKLCRQRTEIINHIWSRSNVDIQAKLILQPIEITFLFTHFLPDSAKFSS